MSPEYLPDSDELEPPEICCGILPKDITQDRLIDIIKMREYVPAMHGIMISLDNYLDQPHNTHFMEAETEAIKKGVSIDFPFRYYLAGETDKYYKGDLMVQVLDFPYGEGGSFKLIAFRLDFEKDKKMSFEQKDKINDAIHAFNQKAVEYMNAEGIGIPITDIDQFMDSKMQNEV